MLVLLHFFDVVRDHDDYDPEISDEEHKEDVLTQGWAQLEDTPEAYSIVDVVKILDHAVPDVLVIQSFLLLFNN